MKTTVAPGEIALTFDDGPDPIWTERVLAVLGNRGATATFFVQGQSVGLHPEVIDAIAGGGHEIALHCFEHTRHSEMTADAIRADAEAGLAALEPFGIRPAAWRPPWGVESEATGTTAEELELELWGWSGDTHDWRGDRAEQMLEVLIRSGLSCGGVILMHDGLGPGARRAGCAETVRLADSLLTLIEEEDLRPTTLSGAPSRTHG